MRAGLHLVVVAALAVAATSAMAADRIRLAVQKTGTLAWELDVIKTHGLDRKLDLQIDTVELASTEAGKIALKSGSAALILADCVGGPRARTPAASLVFYPPPSALGPAKQPGPSRPKAI